MKKIILVRHGQTIQDKSNPDRGLSPVGIKQVSNLAQSLNLSIISPAVILHSNTHRAAQTAHIIGQSLSITNICSANLRIQHIDKIAQLIRHHPAQAYLSLKRYHHYGVESPAQLTKRWLKIISPLKAKTIILVSHEASLEAFLYSQKIFNVKHKSFNQFFDYADYALISRK